jgi:hypothetical protein
LPSITLPVTRSEGPIAEPKMVTISAGATPPPSGSF